MTSRLYNFDDINESVSIDADFATLLDESSFHITESTIDKYNELVNGLPAIVAMYENTGDDKMLEKYSRLLQENKVVTIQEGANAEYTKVFKTKFREACAYAKAGKKAIKKENDPKSAAKLYKQAADKMGEIEKEFKNVDDTVWSDILGAVIAFFVSTIPVAIASIGTIPILNIRANAAVIAQIVQNIMEIVKFVKDYDSSNPKKQWNIYRNKLMTGVELVKKGYEKRAEQCSKVKIEK